MNTGKNLARAVAGRFLDMINMIDRIVFKQVGQEIQEIRRGSSSCLSCSPC